MNKKLQDQYVLKMQECVDTYDEEVAHVNADKLLVEFLTELGYKDLVDKFNKVGKWYA